MTKSIHTTNRSQAGFTLVELAVVMIIIGLLIGGVLKGQELINNAQLTATVAQVKAFDGATSSFRDMYSALPGDIRTPSTRLPSCTTAPCSTTGNGDGRLDDNLSAQPDGEGLRFFVHLAAADLVTGIDPAATAGVGAWGTIYPEAKVSGGFMIGSSTGANGDFAAIDAAVTPRAGLYLGLTATANAAYAATLTPNQAYRIDNKIDDSSPISGSVFSSGANCINANDEYDEQNPAVLCGLFLRIQG